MISISKSKYFLIYIFMVTLLSPTMVSAEEFNAVLSWSKRVELSTPVNGVVQKVFVQAGEIVAKGEALVQLDPRTFKADLKFSMAQLKHMDGASQEAKRELDRQLDMYDRSMLSDHDLQVAKNNFGAAQSKFGQAQSSLVKAKLNLEYSVVRAPFNAIVIKTNSVKGQVVASAMVPPALVVVAEANKMLARFYVTDIKLNSLVLNQVVTISIYKKDYLGKIVRLALEPDAMKGYAVDVIFDLKDILLRAGQKAKVNL